MILSQGQLNFFDTFGYLLIRQLFSPEETEKIIEGFEWSIQNWCGGKDPDRTTRIMFPGPIEHHPDMSAILDHPSILGLIGGGCWVKIFITVVAMVIITLEIPAGIPTDGGEIF